MRRMILLGLIALAAFGTAKAQDEEEPATRGFDPNKLFYGGTFGLSFGSDYTLVNVSPQVGYRFNRYVAAGTGINFIYTNYKYAGYREDYGVLGLGIFGRVYPIPQAFINAQPEMNYTWGTQKWDTGGEQKLDGKFVPSLLAGAGVAIPMGQRGAFLVMVQYDVIQNARTPYGNSAFISIGFNF